MSTRFVFRNSQNHGITLTSPAVTNLYDLVRDGFGAASDTCITTTTASGTNIQMTKTAGGASVGWISAPFPNAVTITTGSADVWVNEDNMNTNTQVGIQFYRWQSGTTATVIGGGVLVPASEAGFSGPANQVFATNFTDQAFSAGDRLVILLYASNIGTMAAGTLTFTFNTAFGSATGDSFFDLNENLTINTLSVADSLLVDDIEPPALSLVVAPRVISGLTPDSLTLVDSVTVQRWVYVPDVTVQIVTAAAGALTISGLTDVVTTVEGPLSVIETPLRMTVSDQLTVVDGVPVVFVPLLVRLINLSGSPDAVTLTESVTVQRWVYVPDVTVVIQAPSTLLTISGLTESLTVAEGAITVLERPLLLNVLDSLTVVDAGVLMDASIPIRITEGTITVVIMTAAATLAINLSGTPELLTVADPVVLVQERQLLLSAVDVVTLADAGAVVRETPLLVTASDLFSTVDAGVAVLESPLILTVTDVLITAESGALVSLVQGLSLTVTDSLITVEGLVTLQLSRLLFTVSDVVSVVDSAALVFLPVLVLTATDALQVTETVSVRLPVLSISASDTTLVVDAGAAAQLVQVLRPSVSDSLMVVDTATPIFFPTLVLSVQDVATLVDAGATGRLSKLLIQASESFTAAEGPLSVFRYQAFYTISATDQVTVVQGNTVVFAALAFISQPLIVFPVPARDFTVEAVIGVTQFVVPPRDLTVEAIDVSLIFPVAARDFTVEAVIGVTQFVVPARDFTVEAQSAA